MRKITNLEKSYRIESRIHYIFAAVLILIVMILIMGVMVNRKALDPEALANFRYMRELDLLEIWTGETFPGHFVTYRPMMATLLRLEYLAFGFNPPAYFVVNQILLAVVALFIYDILYRVTKEMLPAFIGALLFVTDWQIVQTLYVVGEVQVTLAGVFGLWALWLVWFGKREGKLKPALIFLLLIASALSKEFGLSFALALFINALYNRKGRWKTYAIISIAAVITFVILRLLIVPGSPAGREYSSIQNMIKWFTVNIGGGFIFTFVNLFRPASDGDLPSIDTLRFPPGEAWSMFFLQIIPIIIFFILGLWDKEERKFTIPLFFLLIGNSFLFFFNYAFRFHFLGKIGMYTVAGFGIYFITKRLVSNPKTLNILMVGFMYLAAIIFWRGEVFHQYLETHRHWTENGQLCIPTEEYYQQEDFFGYYTVTDPETVRRVMEYYELPIEYCQCLDPYSTCD